MGNFSKSHSLPTYQERKKEIKGDNPLKKARWMRADHIVDQIYCDMVNGVSSSEIILKLANAQYDEQSKPIGTRTAFDYINAAKDRLQYDYENDMKELRADLYGKLLAIYNDAVEEGDRTSALNAIEKIMKLGGMDKQQNNIQINNNSDGIVIKFGFDKKDEETNDV